MKAKRKSLCLIIILSLIVIFELLYSNREAIALCFGGYTEEQISQSAISINGNAKFDDDGGIYITGSGKISFDCDTELYNINLCCKTHSYCTISVSFTDEASEYREQQGNKLNLRPSENTIIGACSAGKASQITVSFESDCKYLTVEKIYINKSAGLRINILRLIICLGIGLFVWAVLNYKWYEIEYDKKYRAAVIAMAVICSISAVIGSVKDMGFDKYPFTDEVGSHTCYQQQADAFIKGQTNLDIDYDTSALDELDNPYDYSERKSAGVSVGGIWDRAYYNGKFYSYFGVAPVILFYVPIAAITGYMPRDGSASMFFTLLTTVVLVITLLKLLEYFRIKPNLLLLCFAIPALCISSLIYVLNVHPSMYYLAIICGILFFSLTLYFTLCASISGMRIFLVLAGVSGVLTVASRPNIFIFCVALIPILWEMILRRNKDFKSIALDITSFAVPLALGAAAIMIYNYSRFDSPFEFGAGYQITFSDMKLYSLEAYKLLPAIYHYFLQPVAFCGDFPYLDIASVKLGVYRGYEYIYNSAGVINFPAAFCCGFGMFRISKGDTKKKLMYIAVTFAAVFVAFADFCLAGSHIRYMGDIMAPLALFGVVFLLDLCEKAKGKPWFGSVLGFCIALCIISGLVGSALLFNNEADNIRKLSPNVYEFFESLFS